MQEVTFEHRFGCTPEAYWALYFNEAFTQTMLVGGLGFTSVDVSPVQETPTELRRTMDVVPKLNLPDAVRHALGPAFGYHEDGRFDRASQTWNFDLRMNALPERIKISGSLTLRQDGENASIRTSTVRVDIKVPLVGGLIERACLANVRSGWEDSARWFERYLHEHGAIPPA